VFTAWWSRNGSQKFLEESKHELAIPTRHWPSAVDIKTNQKPRATATRTTTRGTAMSKEAMKLAIDYLSDHQMGKHVIEALEEALTKQEQGEPVTADEKLARMKSELAYMREQQEQSEPVAWYIREKDTATTDDSWIHEHPEMVEPLYLHPQPKQEQGEPAAYINIEKRRLEWAHDYMSWDTPTVINLPRIPLYTTPQQRKPLRDEMLKQMRESCESNNMEMRGAFIDGWTSAEAAHGIKE
jgi:hypothetical protein